MSRDQPATWFQKGRPLTYSVLNNPRCVSYVNIWWAILWWPLGMYYLPRTGSAESCNTKLYLTEPWSVYGNNNSHIYEAGNLCTNNSSSILRSTPLTCRYWRPCHQLLLPVSIMSFVLIRLAKYQIEKQSRFIRYWILACQYHYWLPFIYPAPSHSEGEWMIFSRIYDISDLVLQYVSTV